MPSQSPWFAGAVVPLSFSNTDTAGTPQDAQTVTCTVTLPDRSTATPAVTHDGTGQYSAKFTSSQAGHHVVLWTAADPQYPGAWADSFEILESADPTIVSLAEAKDILHLSGTASEDLLLHGFNAAATEVAEHFCGAVVTKQRTERLRALNRVFQPSYTPIRTDLGTKFQPTYQRDGSTTNGIVSITPLMTYGFAYGFTDGQAYDPGQLTVDPDTGLIRMTAGFPFFYSQDPIAQYQLTYWAGRAVIPASIYEGCRIVLEHLYAVKRGGVAAQDMAAGESTTIVPGFGFAIPNRAIELFTAVAGGHGAAAGAFA